MRFHVLTVLLAARAIDARAAAAPNHRAAAEAAERQGDVTRALTEAEIDLDAAGLTQLSAALRATSGAAPDSAALSDAASFAFALGSRHASAALMVRAGAWWPDLITHHRDEVRRALIRAPYLRSMLPEDVQAGLKLPDDVSDHELDFRQALGKADRAAVRQEAERLVALDPAHLPAQIALELLDEDPRSLAGAALDLSELVEQSPKDAAATVIRLNRALAGRAGDGRLRLALAWRALNANLAADARRDVARALAAGLSASGRRAAGVIDMLAAFEQGQPAPLRSWLSAQTGIPSSFVVDWILGRYGYEDTLPEEMVVVRRQLLRALFARPPPDAAADPAGGWAWTALHDDKVDADTRGRALQSLGREGSFAPAVKSCAADRLSTEDCVHRVSLVSRLEDDDDDDEDSDATATLIPDLKLLGDQLEIRPAWLNRLSWAPAAALAQLGPWLDRLRRRPVAQSAEFARLDLMVRWASNDLAGARAALAVVRSRPGLPERLALQLLAQDVDEKVLTAQEAPGAFRVPFNPAAMLAGPPSRRPEPKWMAQSFGGRDRLSRFQRALVNLNDGRPGLALEGLEPFWKASALGGEERGTLAAYVFLAAGQVAGKAALADQAAGEVERLVPDSDAAARVRAMRAARAGDRGRLLEAATRWMLLADGAQPAVGMLLSAVASAPGAAFAGPTPAARALLGRAGRIVNGAWSAPGALADLDGPVGAGCWRALFSDAIDDLSSVCGLDAREAIVSNDLDAVSRLETHLNQAVKPAAIVHQARALAGAYEVERLRGPGAPEVAWLRFVAGDAQPRHTAPEASRDAEAIALARRWPGAADPVRRLQLYRRFQRETGNDDDDQSEQHAEIDLPAEAREAGDPRRRALLWHLACLAADPENKAHEARAACAQAWRLGERTPATAKALAEVLFSDLEAARAAGLDAGAFLQQARRALGRRLPAEVRAREASWLITLGRYEEATRALEDAWAGGAGGRLGQGVPTGEMATIPFDPLLARYRAALPSTRGQRALALAAVSLSAGDSELGAAYGSQARLFFRADTDGSREIALAVVGELDELIAADRKDGLLDSARLARLSLHLFGGTTAKEALNAGDAGDTRSALAGLARMEDAIRNGTAKAEVETARKLLARFPRNALVANEGVVLMQKAGLAAEATTTWNAARKLRPDSALLRDKTAVASTKPAPAPRPSAPPVNMADAAAWGRLLASPLPPPEEPAALQRITNDKLGFDVVVPAGFTEAGSPANGVTYTRDGVNLVFMRIPRVTYCEGLPCLDQIIPSIEQQGLKKRWRRVLTSPIGPGAEAYLTSTGLLFQRALVVASLPSNGYLYLFAAGGPERKLAESAAVVRTAFASLRPLDLVLPQPIATRLRGEGFVTPAALLQARAALVRPPATGCPLAGQKDLTPALLVDAFLSTPWALTRRHLLECERASDPPSAALTLAALWDEDRAVRRLGAARVAAGAPAVVAEAKRLMRGDTPIAPPSGSAGTAPDYRWTQLLVALPVKERAQLAGWLLHQDAPHLRAIGLLAARLEGVEFGREHLSVLREGTTVEARIAMQALPPVLAPAVRHAIDARIDRARPPLADEERALLVSMAERLGADPEPADRARFGRLLRVLDRAGGGADSDEGRAPRARLEALIHKKPARPASRPDRRVVRSPATLDAPLAEIVPARWSSLRIPHPRQLLSRLASLARGLKSPSRDRQLLAQSAISRLVAEADQVGADSGEIDLDRPIECASEDASFSSMICAGSRLPEGTDAVDRTTRALEALGMVAAGTVAAPILLPALPFVIHQKVYGNRNETEQGQKAPFVHESAEVWRDTRAGRLSASMRLQIDPDGSGSISDRITVRAGGRLFFANSPWIASAALGDWLASGPATETRAAPAARPPAAAPGDEGADLIASLKSDHGDASPGRSSVLEATITAGGIATRLRLPIRKPAAAASLWSFLPADPALAFAVRDLGWSDTDDSGQDAAGWMLLSHLETTGAEPPVWLAAATQSLAFGWYPTDGGKLWDDWFVAVSWDEHVAGAWSAHGLPAPAAGGAVGSGGGYQFKRAGGTLLVSNRAGLLDQKPVGGAAEPDQPARSVFDGARIARAFEQLAARAPGAEVATALRIGAALTSIIKGASVTSQLDAGTREVTVQSLLSPQVQGGAEAALVEEWQGESRIQNTVNLPRALTDDDGRRPLAYVIEMDHDEDIASVFPTTARQRIQRVAPHRWRLTVAPGPGLDAPIAPRAKTAGDGEPSTDASALAPRVRSAANEIVPRGTPPRQAARLVLEWLRRNMTYELTPREVSDEAILETRRGDCTEYSKLAIALLRAKGIPARSHFGFLADGAALVAHEWVEFYDGAAWREIDPTSAGASVDARFIDASMIDVVPRLSLGRIRVVSVE